MTPDDTLKSLNTNIANANKALEIAIQQLDDAVQALRIANMNMNLAMYKPTDKEHELFNSLPKMPTKPDLKVIK